METFAYFLKYQNFYLKLWKDEEKLKLDIGSEDEPHFATFFPNKVVAEMRKRQIIEIKESDEIFFTFGKDFDEKYLKVYQIDFSLEDEAILTQK